MAWFHQFLKLIYHDFIWPIRTNFRIISEKITHFFQVVAKKNRIWNSELVKPFREQLSYQGKKDHGPPKVCKLILIRLELCSKRLEHYYVLICTYFYLFCHLFFCKFHLKEENFNRMMCEHRQQHDVFGRTENPSNHWEGTRKPTSNITMGPNIFRL